DLASVSASSRRTTPAQLVAPTWPALRRASALRYRSSFSPGRAAEIPSLGPALQFVQAFFPFAFFHRAFAAFRPFADLCRLLNFAFVTAAPFWPPRRPAATKNSRASGVRLI